MKFLKTTLKILYTIYPITKAIIGEMIKASRIFIKPLKFNELKPAAAIAAPAIEPMIACEELLGIP